MSAFKPYQGIVVVIPTRNRPELAINALRSVLPQMGTGIQVLISDNSTSEDNRAQLGAFCQNLADQRVRYVVPPALMAMTDHWDWALREALESYQASHFVYLTDRMMFKPGALTAISDIVQLYPDRIISYNHDMIDDDQRPILVEQYPWTGKLLDVSCLRLSYLYSQSYFHHCLPRMLNSVAPRSVLRIVRERFGNYFGSIAPDFNFGFRCLDVCDSILFYDRSPIFHYALNRSNGASHTRGELTPDSLDFAANLAMNSSERNYATPIPQLISTGNAIMNEYFILRQETRSSRFFEVDIKKYVQRMAEELDLMVDVQARAEAERLLTAHGRSRPRASERLRHLAGILVSRHFPGRLLSELGRDRGRPLPERWWLFLARNFGVKLSDDHRFQFRTLEAAMQFIHDFPRSSSRLNDGHNEVLQAKEMPAV